MHHIHLMGIGGAGMSGLALLLKDMGFAVSGCDMVHTSYAEKVVQHKIELVLGHHQDHLERFSPDLLVYTSAISEEHPEIRAARERGIPVARRAEVLSDLFNRRRGIGVAGTHGKTTTSSMIALIAENAGISPTVALGGELCDIGCNAKLGSGETMVAELDESDGSFELFSPEIAVVTNIDWDHVDHYPTYESVGDAFHRFALGKKPAGSLVLCAEDAGTRRLAERLHEDGLASETLYTYGWGTSWTWGATDVTPLPGGGIRCLVHFRGTPLGTLSLRVSGEHNVLNALAACAACSIVGIPFEVSCRALSTFKGAKRRLQRVGAAEGVEVYDDYGHHPREIHATLRALRGAFPHRRLLVLFQPHRFTRTAAMFREFATVLTGADRVLLLPVYGADETPIPGVGSHLIAEAFPKEGPTRLDLCGSFSEAVEVVLRERRDQDVVLTVGAGNVCLLGERILDSLKRESSLAHAVAVGA
ncbi:UDP-N-acetylmuramate--L-alanine ligase [Aminomonas paucivorans]|nr:UDP-N-acetylmuramate--L-alanine ligase [Aminomonas paucivorans]